MLSVFLPPSFPFPLTFKVFAHTRRRLSAMEGKLNLYSALICQHLFSIIILTPQHLCTLRNHKSLFRFTRVSGAGAILIARNPDTLMQHTVCTNNMSPSL